MARKTVLLHDRLTDSKYPVLGKHRSWRRSDHSRGRHDILLRKSSQRDYLEINSLLTKTNVYVPLGIIDPRCMLYPTLFKKVSIKIPIPSIQTQTIAMCARSLAIVENTILKSSRVATVLCIEVLSSHPTSSMPRK